MGHRPSWLSFRKENMTLWLTIEDLPSKLRVESWYQLPSTKFNYVKVIHIYTTVLTCILFGSREHLNFQVDTYEHHFLSRHYPDCGLSHIPSIALTESWSCAPSIFWLALSYLNMMGNLLMNTKWWMLFDSRVMQHNVILYLETWLAQLKVLTEIMSTGLRYVCHSKLLLQSSRNSFIQEKKTSYDQRYCFHT